MVNKMKIYYGLKDFLRNIYSNRKIIIKLSKNDFKSKFTGSFAGILWAFIVPLVNILVFWFIFQVGFRSAPVEDIPFILWLSSGLIPWFFFGDAWNNATNSLFEYSYLVKKVKFRVSLLPIIKIISALFVHIFFIFFLYFLFIVYGRKLDFAAIQLFYYSFALVMFLIGLSWFTSAVSVFIKDLTQLIQVLLQVGFWLTPIFWNINIIDEKYKLFFKLNPLHYIVSGYRGALIDGVWFWELSLMQTIYFWLVTLFMFVIGGFVFLKSRPHFADVL